MSLDYDLTECNKDLYCEDEGGKLVWKDYVQGMIFTTMSVDIGHLTEENASEFYARQKVWAQLRGFTPYTSEQVHSLIGMRTNVGGVNRRGWMARITNQMESLKREYQYDREEVTNS